MSNNEAGASTPLRKPKVIAHRGASTEALENSIVAFRIAAETCHAARCDGVELDVHCAQDGTFVVHHDPLLHTGHEIARISKSMVRASLLRDGSQLPTLDTALEVLAGVDVYIELKALPAEFEAALLDVAVRSRARCHFHAFDHRLVARLAARKTGLSLGVLSRSYPVDPVRQVIDAGAGTLWQEAGFIDRALVERCHAADVAVIAWTVDTPSQARALAAHGVDALCGDAPERLRD